MLTVSGYHLKTRLGNCELPTATVTITYVSGLLFHMWICTGTRTLTDTGKLQTVLLNTANTPRCRRLSSRPLRDAAPGRRRAATARAACRGVQPDRRPRTARAPAPRAPSAPGVRRARGAWSREGRAGAPRPGTWGTRAARAPLATRTAGRSPSATRTSAQDLYFSTDLWLALGSAGWNVSVSQCGHIILALPSSSCEHHTMIASLIGARWSWWHDRSKEKLNKAWGVLILRNLGN